MAVRHSVMLARRRDAVVKFMRELDALLGACEPDQSFTSNMPTWVPKAGQERFVAAQRGVVDQLTRPAAIALDSVGVDYDFKRSGTWQTQSMNPVLAWSTLLNSPMITADLVYSLCNQAIGQLSAQVSDAVEHEGSLEGRVERVFGTPWRLLRAAFGHSDYAPKVDAAGTVVSLIVTLLAAYITYRLHWV